MLKAKAQNIKDEQAQKIQHWFAGLFTSHSHTATKWPIDQMDLDLDNIPVPSIHLHTGIVSPVTLTPDTVGSDQAAIAHTPFLPSSVMSLTTTGPSTVPSFVPHSMSTHVSIPAPFDICNSTASTHTIMPTVLYPYYYHNSEPGSPSYPTGSF
jgi:hypothetical protein